jgi:arylsulfatase A-like enzyme
VLVVLDGVRWQEAFDDAVMPHLRAIASDRGAALGAPDSSGPAITASGPAFVSLPGYTEIFTGQRSHPCADNDCAATRQPTIADDVRAGEASEADVAVFASWAPIERAATTDPSRVVLSAGRSRLSHRDWLDGDPIARASLERGARAGPFPGHGDFRPDRFTAALALRYLETRRPRFLFLGLGEADEYAHRGDYAGYVASLRAADDVLGALVATLDRMGARGAGTALFVTTDHGRARDYRHHGRAFPESARVWVVASGAGISARGRVRAERPHRLADVAPTLRLLLAVDAAGAPSPSDGAPFDELFASPAPALAASTP